MTPVQILQIAALAASLAERILSVVRELETGDRAIELVGVEQRLAEAREALKRAVEVRGGAV